MEITVILRYMQGFYRGYSESFRVLQLGHHVVQSKLSAAASNAAPAESSSQHKALDLLFVHDRRLQLPTSFD